MLEEVALPIVVPLSPVKDGEIFNQVQWATLTSMCEVVIPSIDVTSRIDSLHATLQPYISSSCTKEVIKDYFAESVVGTDLRESLRRRFVQFIPKSQVGAFSMVLATLNTRAGLLLMTGGLTPLQSLSIQDRTRVMCGWSQSYLAPLRAIYGSIELLAKLSWLPVSASLHKLTGFPVVPEHVERNPSFEFKFKFADFSTRTEKTIHLEYDIVIVGSGCGAGVIASHLARNTADMNPKPRIVVIEKSYHYPSSHFPMAADTVGEHLLETGGGLQADDGSIAILAGSTWGGGGTVNWSASLQPQHFVREEWESKGLKHFTTPEFQDCLDTVCDRMGVARMNDEEAKSRIPHNFGNKVLLEGARKLGMTCEVVPQNSKGFAHECGYCSEGCASATKQGPANCWLPDAAGHGVDFIEGCFVHEILWDDSTTVGKARGIHATWTSRDRSISKPLTIASSRVIVSGGTLNSPCLLIRSNITSYHLGRHLHLHPTMAISSIWPNQVKPWTGPILTAAVTSYENADGFHHGPKIEMLAGTPSYTLPWLPWTPTLSLSPSPGTPLPSAYDYKVQCAKYAHTSTFIAIQRDRDTGRIYLEPRDPTRSQLRIEYTPSKHDRTCLLEGVIATARIAYTQGAVEIRPYTADIPSWVRSATASEAENDAGFREWVAEVRETGINGPPACRLGSAHQMGTCRMSAKREEGVVDLYGRVWGVQGVYVADASVFPSASGVNPMVTTMGIAEWIGRALVRELKGL